MTTVESKCVNLTGDLVKGPITVTINPADYDQQLKKPILPVIITLTKLLAPYTVDIKIGSTLSYTLEVSSDKVGKITNSSPGISVTFPKTNTGTYKVSGLDIPNATINSVVLSTKNMVEPLPYNDRDEYLITMISKINLSGGTACSQISFIRQNNTVINTKICDLKETKKGYVRIPALCISGQSMLDGTDVSDMSFTIFDNCEYYDKKCIIDKDQRKCQLLKIKSCDLKETKFIKCCPWMVSVTIGKGDTLRDKLEYLIRKNKQPDNMDIDEFLYNMMYYGMTRYILSKILYGKFDIKCLLKKNYNKFIKDLGRSKFCRFVDFFEEFEGYENYFLRDIQ